MHYKIKALAVIGIEIILHYFDYNSSRDATGLKDSCVAIHSYKRKSFFRSLPLFQPHIIQSRINEELIQRLNNDDHPVLLEGLHCAGIIPFLINPGRVVVRMHNEEAAYYHYLSKAETSLLKRNYFIRESNLLKRYQTKMNKAIKLACLSSGDLDMFRSGYHFQDVHFIPCFIPWQKVAIQPGIGAYCLYHGNMAVSENAEAALWLIRNVFKEVKIPLIIAGRAISTTLMNFAEKYPHISFINNPSITEIDELVRNAHINVLPSLNATGVKLKLLNALLNGRFCLTNPNGVMGSGLEKFVTASDSVASWKETIHLLMSKEFTDQLIAERAEVLSVYNNEANAKKLSELW